MDINIPYHANWCSHVDEALIECNNQRIVANELYVISLLFSTKQPRPNARRFYWLFWVLLKSEAGSKSTEWHASVWLHCPWHSVWQKLIIGHHLATWVACILTANRINNGMFARPGYAALYWRFYIRPRGYFIFTFSKFMLFYCISRELSNPIYYAICACHTL